MPSFHQKKVKIFLKIALIFCFLSGFRSKTAVSTWGFWAHQRINRLAVFTLPPEMIVLFKKNIDYLTENSVNPDRRRYAVVGEAPRHYIDLENYGDSAAYKLPHYWKEATERFGEDSLLRHGVVPWAIQQYKYRLTEAFREKKTRNILRLAADLGHYIADANVPLHTTRNYNGQLSGQEGIHAFWESRLTELFAEDYNLLTGTAQYESKVARRAWQAVQGANVALDSVLRFESQVSAQFKDTEKYVLEDRNGIIVKTYSRAFSERYHQLLDRQVERQMRNSAKMVGDLWFTAWVDAGQPDLTELSKIAWKEQDKKEDDTEKQSWLKRLFNARTEGDN
jgi:hypothetical protein